MSMPTLKEYREQAGLSLAELARLANIDYKTARKADNQEGEIARIKARALIHVINTKLGLSLTLDEIDGLQVRG